MEFIPATLEEFYLGSLYSAYAKSRDLDCYYAEKICGYEKVPLKTTHRALSGYANGITLEFNWIYNKKGEALNLNSIAFPDSRVPNYTTSFNDCIEIAKLLHLPSLPIDTTEELIRYILLKADRANDEN